MVGTLSLSFHPIVQEIEWASGAMAAQRTFNPLVVGSTPTGPAEINGVG